MIIKRKKQLSDRVGEISYREMFLWWPVKTYDEWWWLERVVMTEELCRFTNQYGKRWYGWDLIYIETFEERARRVREDYLRKSSTHANEADYEI